MPGRSYSDYGITAGFYDRINSGVDFSAWADFIEAVFARFCEPEPELVLDLACGTGTLAVELAKRGYDMTGLDISPDMLSIAREKSEAAGADVLWLCQDMRSFELYGTVDAVISCCDSINYLCSRAELISCFSLVYNYLSPGGIFLFDVTSRAKFRGLYGTSDIIIESGDCGPRARGDDPGGEFYCGWKNAYNDKSGRACFSLSYFVLQGDMWRRYDEKQYQRCFTVSTLCSALSECGFDILLVTPGYDMEPLSRGGEDDESCERIYIAARVRKDRGGDSNRASRI